MSNRFSSRFSLATSAARRTRATLLAFAAIFFCVAVADAGPANIPFPIFAFSDVFQPPGKITQFKLIDFENFYTPTGALETGTIQVGDTLQGIFNITSSSQPNGANPINPDRLQFSGAFSAYVSAVTPTSSAGVNAFTFTPDPSFATRFSGPNGSPTLPTGSMIALYQYYLPTSTALFNPSTGSLAANATINAPAIQAAYATAATGTLCQVAGAVPGSIWGTNYYCAAVGSPTPGVSSFAASLNLLYADPILGIPADRLSTMLTQQVPAYFSSQAEIDALSAIQNPIALQGHTKIQTDTTVPFEIQREDPLQQQVVPEPGSILLIGVFLGVWGMGLAVHRGIRSAPNG